MKHHAKKLPVAIPIALGVLLLALTWLLWWQLGQEPPSPIAVDAARVESVRLYRDRSVWKDDDTCELILREPTAVADFCARWNNEWVTQVEPYIVHTLNVPAVETETGNVKTIRVTFSFTDGNTITYTPSNDYIYCLPNQFYFAPNYSFYEGLDAWLVEEGIPCEPD